MWQQNENLNMTWARLLMEELVRLGLQHVCIAPGSRSAPLTLAAAEQSGLQTHLHFDERGLGFFALGLAKQLAAPVALITTSGTAVANLYPAVIEASLTQVPLIVLSADRPAELIDCGANQAIPQQGIFAGYPVFTQSLPAPELRIDPRFLLGTLDQLWAEIMQQPGPAHLNCPYPEPLYPGQGRAVPTDWFAPLSHWSTSGRPFTEIRPARPAIQPEPGWADFASQSGIILAGQLHHPDEAEALLALAKQLGWPLIADVQSQLAGHPDTLPLVDLALHNAHFRQQLGAARVLLQVGARFLSKRLSQFISQHPWQARWLLAPSLQRLAPDYGPSRRIQAPIADWCRHHQATLPAPPVASPLRLNTRAIRQCLDARLADWSELAIAEQVGARAPGPLLIGNSLPARLLDMLMPIRSPQAGPIFSNRGASGIDGLIATAVGIATGSRIHTTLLIGDTSALHDLNSLALTRQPGVHLVIVLVNNDGGAIFGMLPGASQSGHLNDCFRLPHGLDFAHAAAQFGLSYYAVTDLAAFDQAWQCASQGGVSLIECQVEPEQATRLLRDLARDCQEALIG